MELVVQGFGKEYVIEVGEDDTIATMRQKVASASGLREDSFRMGFGGKDEGEDITQLSAGDIVVLEKTPKYEAIAALHALGETDVTAETLKNVRDPKVASLLLQAEVATEIPDYFFAHSALTRICFGCVSDVDDNCDTTLHLPALPCVTEIGDTFFSGCRGLSTADLTGLRAVTTINNSFFFRCTMLSTVDFSSLQAVTTIGDWFLCQCTTLSTLDLTGLQAVTTIGDWFLGGCTGLSTVDLSSLLAVTVIGKGFLSSCTALSTVDVSGLQAVTTIGDNFLHRCPALQTVHGKDKCSNAVRMSCC